MLNEWSRSYMYSILKCEFGWNGCYPDGLDSAAMEAEAMTRACARDAADFYALALSAAGCNLGPNRGNRLDGKPHRAFVVDGFVFRRQKDARTRIPKACKVDKKRKTLAEQYRQKYEQKQPAAFPFDGEDGVPF